VALACVASPAGGTEAQDARLKSNPIKANLNSAMLNKPFTFRRIRFCHLFAGNRNSFNGARDTACPALL
jgi:hypothetical protein